MENKKKRRGMLAVLLGLVLTVCGGALTLTVGGRLEYILPAPAATQEGGELNALYEEAQKQMASIADSITAGAVGARAQGVNLSAEAQSAEATVYAVGSGEARGERRRDRRAHGALLLRGQRAGRPNRDAQRA